MADMLLLFTSSPINWRMRSEDVSIAIFWIFSGALFTNSATSASAFLISIFISLSNACFFFYISSISFFI